jgi:hypothetical protein
MPLGSNRVILRGNSWPTIRVCFDVRTKHLLQSPGCEALCLLDKYLGSVTISHVESCLCYLHCSLFNSPDFESLISTRITIIICKHAHSPTAPTAHFRRHLCATCEPHQANPIQLLCRREPMRASPSLRRPVLSDPQRRECRANLLRPQARLEPCDERAPHHHWHASTRRAW